MASTLSVTHHVFPQTKDGAFAGANHVYKARFPLGQHQIQVRIFSKDEAPDLHVIRELIAKSLASESVYVEKVKRQCTNPTKANLDFWINGEFIGKCAKNIPHNHLVKLMKVLGYPPNDEGICFGAAIMAMQAILSRQITSFDGRILFLLALNKREIVQKIAAAKQIKTDIFAMFDGVQLYQLLRKYQHLFELEIDPDREQNILISAMRASSKKIEEEGGIVTLSSFSGIYSKRELVIYLQGLRDAYRGQLPLALILGSSRHTLTLGYDGHKKMFFDVNSAPTHYFSNEEALAVKLLLAFSRNDFASFSTAVYATKANSEPLVAVVHDWQAQAGWKSIHTVTPAKALLADSDEISWFFTAASEGHLDVVKKMVKISGFKANRTSQDGKTAFYIATAKKQHAVMRELIKQAVDPNLASLDGTTPLHKAVQSRNVENVKEVLKAPNIDPNKARNGLAPLHIAALNGDLPIVEELLAHSTINPDLIHNGKTPLEMAMVSGQTCVVDFLQEHPKVRLQPDRESQITYQLRLMTIARKG